MSAMFPGAPAAASQCVTVPQSATPPSSTFQGSARAHLRARSAPSLSPIDPTPLMWAYSMPPSIALPNTHNSMQTNALPNLASSAHFSSEHFNPASYGVAPSDHAANHLLAAANRGANAPFNVGHSFHHGQALSQAPARCSSNGVADLLHIAGLHSAAMSLQAQQAPGRCSMFSPMAATSPASPMHHAASSRESPALPPMEDGTAARRPSLVSGAASVVNAQPQRFAELASGGDTRTQRFAAVASGGPGGASGGDTKAQRLNELVRCMSAAASTDVTRKPSVASAAETTSPRDSASDNMSTEYPFDSDSSPASSTCNVHSVAAHTTTSIASLAASVASLAKVKGVNKIIPRRKAGQRERTSTQPVVLDEETLTKLFSIPLHQAAASLGISATALKSACRKLGVHKWPFRAVQ
ncbi:hypothetical protein T484DRAFT_1899593, partial [Baffinella frigidus]